MSFTMEIPSQKEIQKVIEEEIKPVPAEVAELQQVANSNVDMIMNLDLESLEKRKEILQSIDGFGMNTMRSSSEKTRCFKSPLDICPRRETRAAGRQRLDRAAHATEGSRPERGRFRQNRLLGKLFNSLRAHFLKYQPTPSSPILSFHSTRAAPRCATITHHA